MKCIAVAALAVAVTLAGWTPGLTKEKEYVKVKIRGILRLQGKGPGLGDRILVRDQPFSLDLKRIVGIEMSEKQLKTLEDEYVIVQGHLVLHRDPNFWIEVAVTKISRAPAKKDK